MNSLLGPLIYFLHTAFLFIVFFVPTSLPFRLGSLFFFSAVAVCLMLYKGALRISFFELLFLLTVVAALLSGLTRGALGNSAPLSIQAFFFILLNMLGVRVVFSLHTSQFHLDYLVKLIIVFTFMLSLLLIFEAFFYSPYFYHLGITAMDSERVIHLVDGSRSSHGVTELFGMQYARAFGPFRYPLLAGYTLLLGALYQFNILLRNISSTNALILFPIIFAILLISKSAFFGFMGGALWLTYRSADLNRKKKLIIFLAGAISISPVIFQTIIKHVLFGEGVGSFLLRADIYTQVVATFFGQSSLTVLFGHGLGFTWYGNEEFMRLYSGSTSDFGMYLNTMLQGGVVSLFLLFVLACKVVFMPRLSSAFPNQGIIEASNAFFVSTIISWVGLSNYDILFWLFIAIGITSLASKLK